MPETDESDAVLVDAARAADVDARTRAFGALVRRHERSVRALALSLLHDPTEAEDMAQEAFLRAFGNLDMLADPAKFGVWLRRITFGVCVDWLRAFRPHLFRSTDLAPSSESGRESRAAVPFETPDEAPTALELLERAEIAERVLGAIARLPVRYRVPFTLFHVDGLSHAKVAAALGAPESTVRSLVTRARRKLVQLLDDGDSARPRAVNRATLDVFDEPRAAPRLLHVLNGDVVRETLERSDVPGDLAVWADVLHEGPVPRETGTAAWRELRARFIAERGFASHAEALRRYEEWDARLESFRDADEVVLWFEHDLFDQLLLARHLHWFSRRDRGRTALRLICIGEFPGVEDFAGLGQLSADQLASLLGTRQPVGEAQLRLGRDAWDAVTAPDPASLVALAQRLGALDDDSDVPNAAAPLPFLGGALRRLLAEYPAVGDGLPLTERRILECLRTGPLTLPELFVAEQRLEERVFMGDWSFWWRVRALATGPVPLLLTDGSELPTTTLSRVLVELTPSGREVLDGRADWVKSCGYDRWIGGVHLRADVGGEVRWRWDPEARRINAK